MPGGLARQVAVQPVDQGLLRNRRASFPLWILDVLGRRHQTFGDLLDQFVDRRLQQSHSEKFMIERPSSNVALLSQAGATVGAAVRLPLGQVAGVVKICSGLGADELR